MTDQQIETFKKPAFLLFYFSKKESPNHRIFRGAVFDLSHMKSEEHAIFCKKVIFFYILMIFQIIKWICFVKLIEFSWIYINLKRFETLNFMYFSQISLILAKNDMFLWFHNMKSEEHAIFCKKVIFFGDFDDFSSYKMNLFCEVDWIFMDLH